jgi:hypothetical protein
MQRTSSAACGERILPTSACDAHTGEVLTLLGCRPKCSRSEDTRSGAEASLVGAALCDGPRLWDSEARRREKGQGSQKVGTFPGSQPLVRSPITARADGHSVQTSSLSLRISIAVDILVDTSVELIVENVLLCRVSIVDPFNGCICQELCAYCVVLHTSVLSQSR